MTNNNMQHFGVKGMRWGVRKGKSSAPKKAKGLTDAQLSTAVKRMQLERTYKSLSAEANQSRFTKNKNTKLVKEIVGAAFKQTATAYVSKGMTSAIDLGISKARG